MITVLWILVGVALVASGMLLDDKLFTIGAAQVVLVQRAVLHRTLGKAAVFGLGVGGMLIVFLASCVLLLP